MRYFILKNRSNSKKKYHLQETRATHRYKINKALKTFTNEHMTCFAQNYARPRRTDLVCHIILLLLKLWNAKKKVRKKFTSLLIFYEVFAFVYICNIVVVVVVVAREEGKKNFLSLLFAYTIYIHTFVVLGILVVQQ